MPNVKKRGKCSVKDCTRDHFALTYCQMHYARVRRRGTVDPPSRVLAVDRYNDLGERKCSTCGQFLAVGEFGKQKNSPDGLKNDCRNCLRSKRIARNYRLSESAYQDLLEQQDGVCAVCGERSSRMAVDHDHSCCHEEQTCGICVRGLLCVTCNVRLGVIEDRAWLEKAMRYLEKGA